MDYFVSADFMEHPHRTRMAVEDEPYTEQVVLLEGQGIWYSKPVDPDGLNDHIYFMYSWTSSILMPKFTCP